MEFSTSRSSAALLLTIVAICIQSIAGSGGTNSTYDNVNVPCSFRESINITAGYRDSDDAILFEGLMYTANDYGVYNYEFINDTIRQPVRPHLRGCICRLRSCVRTCCPRGQFYNESMCRKDEQFANMRIDVLEPDNTTSVSLELFDEFAYINGRPCGAIFELDPIYDEDRWILLRVSAMRGTFFS